MRPRASFPAALLLGLLSVGPTSAPAETPTAPAPETTSMESELKALRQEIQALRNEQRRMRVLLERSLRDRPSAEAPAGPVAIDLEGAPRKGDAEARLVLVEVADYQCPYCARHSVNTAPEIEERYVETGKVQLAFVDLPLPMHPHAAVAAEAAHCAGDQGRFWEMHDLLFARFREIEPDTLAEWAGRLGVDRKAFEACMESGRHGATVDRSSAAAREAGVDSTPSFLLGYADPESSRLEVVETVTGAQALEAFVRKIDRLLDSREVPAD